MIVGPLLRILCHGDTSFSFRRCTELRKVVLLANALRRTRKRVFPLDDVNLASKIEFQSGTLETFDQNTSIQSGADGAEKVHVQDPGTKEKTDTWLGRKSSPIPLRFLTIRTAESEFLMGLLDFDPGQSPRHCESATRLVSEMSFSRTNPQGNT